MKNVLKTLGTIALGAIIIFSTVSCSGGGGKAITSAEALKAYIESQPANGPDKPIKVSMAINEPMLKDVVGVIQNTNKYVSLNITGKLLTKIGGFSGCKMLAGITIPSSVTSVDGEAFYSCSSLTSVTIPSSVTSIERSAFSYCTSLASITIPSSVTSIGSSAFDKTAWFESQPDGLVYAGKNLYKYKGEVLPNTPYYLKAGTIAIADGAFRGQSRLGGVSIPTSVTSIGYGAFYGCDGLINITIPTSVTAIGESAFYGCYGLINITIPASVTAIGMMAFANWGNAQTITVQGKASQLAADAAWGGDAWRNRCRAKIVYEG